MIVPRSKLLFWTAAVVLPFAALAAVFAQGALLAIGAIGLFAALILLDAVMALGSLDDISVELPQTVRLSKDRDGEIEIQIKSGGKKARALRVGLALPRQLHSPDEDLMTLLPAQNQFSRFAWPCTPLKRGSFSVQKCHLEGSSLLGFWSVRKTVPVQSEVRVYPNLLTERNAVSALFLNRGNFGAHAQRQVGKGRDFEKLREYQPGDNFDEIHWKATAKRNRPVTKVFQIERTQEIYVIIDASRLSARTVVSGASENSYLERFITAGLILGAAAEKQGDLFGILTFSDKVQNFVRARNGKAHYSSCRDALYTLQPQTVTPDFDEICSFIRLRLRRRALLVFLTALDDPILAESFTKNMDLLCRQHLIVVNMMKAPGIEPLFSRPDVSSTDAIYQRLGGHLLWSKLRELEKVLQHRGIRFSLVENEKLSSHLITQYMGIKRRQLL